MMIDVDEALRIVDEIEHTEKICPIMRVPTLYMRDICHELKMRRFNSEYHYDAEKIYEKMEQPLTESYAELATVTKERDAAVADMAIPCKSGEICFVCVHGEQHGGDYPCTLHKDWCGGVDWGWRGVQNG